MAYKPAADLDVCYVTIDNKQYDCSKFKDFHPGGRQVLEQYHERDATDVFHAFHGKEAFKKLANMKSTPKTFPVPAEAAAFREFRKKLDKEGWFEASKLWFLYKTTEVMGVTFLGLYLGSIGHWFIGAILLGFGFQQQGWLSHDYCHQQVFENRRLNNFMAYICGSVASGYSVNWWKERHNTHHAITNVFDSDPDIDNLPLFAWDEKDFPRVASVPGASSIIPYQHLYFLPWTPLLKIIWKLQSLVFISNKHSSAWEKAAIYEKATLLFHWTWLLTYCAFVMPSIGVAFAFFFIAEFVGGAGIANIVFMNHYACDHPENLSTSFVNLQLATTVNIEPNTFMNWFSGGLNLQVEHHLFPTMPRHNLFLVRPLVQQFCKENGLQYQSRPFFECISCILAQLSKMSSAYLKYKSAQPL